MLLLLTMFVEMAGTSTTRVTDPYNKNRRLSIRAAVF